MGFKFKRIDFVSGSAAFPLGTGSTETNTRLHNVIGGLADALINMSGLHWVIDTDYCSSTSDFKDVPNSNNATYNSGLFLKNTESGCKLFIAYMSYYGIKNFGGSDLCQIKSSSGLSGVVVSMIPDGSTSVFGSSFDSSFLPSDATRFVGTCASNGSYCYDPSSGYIYTWAICATDYVIVIFGDRTSRGTPADLEAPSYSVGRIIGTLAHSEDDPSLHKNARYGVLFMRELGSNSDWGNLLYDYYSIFGSNVNFVGNASGNYTTSVASVCRSDGTWIKGTDHSTYAVKVFPESIGQLNGKIFSPIGTGKSRWIPFIVMCYANDLSVNGIVTGDGVKGYIDTDLFRCAKGAYGQQFDNGNFICIDSTNNLLLGWDSTNTDQIAGA